MGDEDDHRGQPFFKNDGFNVNSKIMISAIASLAFVVILVLALHVYARYMMRRQARRRRLVALQNIGVTVSLQHLGTDAQHQQQPKAGLEPSVIASLPIFAFTKSDETSTDCSVCLSLLETEEMVRRLPNCNHTFHAQCIDIWLGSHSTCPICRTEAEPIIRQSLPTDSVVDILQVQEPTAPPIDGTHIPTAGEGITSGCGQLPTAKVGGSSGSRLSSFRRILSRERSLPRVQSRGQDDGLSFDPERQQQNQTS